MSRPVLTELALFLTPFVLYALYLWAIKADILHPDSWPVRRVAWLTIAALLLMVGSFLLLAHFGGEPPGMIYVPAHMENGQLIPGQYVPGPNK
jgi:hypothetical protein